MTNTFAETDPWRAIPLCCRYFAVHFDSLSVSAFGGGQTSHEMTLTWALGVLRDGECEALGVWPASVEGSTFWRRVCGELQVRGVEQISLISVNLPTDLLFAYSCSTVLPNLERTYPLTSRHRRILREMGCVVNRLNQGLSRAATRYGCFSSPAAATSFVVDRLTRAECNLGAFGAGAFASPAYAVASPLGLSGIAALGV
jgi:hypothetical protein